MNYIVKFLEKESQRKDISVKQYPNGVKIVYNKYPIYNKLHSYYKPLSDEQILDLEFEVNIAQQASYNFPTWYKEFFKTTNGLNIFFESLVLYGEQTPLINDNKYGKIRGLIERDNPNWVAPYNLRSTNSVKFDLNSKRRWLTIGCYRFDKTQIAIDFKNNCLVAMYSLPINIKMKDLRNMKESDYEKLIICVWKDFETFFINETNRLSEVIDNNIELDQDEFTVWKKTLPLEHKDYEK